MPGQGQDKTYTVTKPETGETRVVTQAEWRAQKLGQQGFTKLTKDDGTIVTLSATADDDNVVWGT